MNTIPLTRPDISYAEVEQDLRTVLKSGRLTTGPYVHEFERRFAELLDVSHALTFSSCSTALHCALAAVDIGPGDEVLVADFSFPATGNVVVQTGARPVLVDVRAGNFDMDIEVARSLVTERTRAIVPVDPFGQPADMRAVCALADEFRLFVLEDAACAVGTMHGNRAAGAWPGAGAFSFHPRKIVTTGEGGMLTTHNEDLARRLRSLRNHGRNELEGVGRFDEFGFNYRMSELQAVLGLAQLQRLSESLNQRRELAMRYLTNFEGLTGVSVPLSSPVSDCTFQSFIVFVDPRLDRDRIIEQMHRHGIETTIGTYALHAQKSYARFGYCAGDLPNALHAQRHSLAIPLFRAMTEQDVDRVCEALAQSLLTVEASSA